MITTSFHRRFFLLAALTCGLLACGPRQQIELGLYRAVLSLPGGELPFGLELKEESGAPVAYLINGPERVRVPDVKRNGGKLALTMPGYGNRLEAQLKDGQLVGEVVLVKLGGKEQHIPLVAQPGASYRFFPEPSTDNADVSGRWAVSFTDQDGKQYAGVGEFQQNFHAVTGTFLTPTGDHRFLAGEMRGDELYLSAFDGAHAYLHRARVAGNGQLQGKFWSGLAWNESWVAQRDEQAALSDEDAVTAIDDNTWSFGFTYRDQDGKPVSLADERFRGKVVIVTLAGSWCPNCHDEAAFLAPFYKEYRARGLEVVALMFEHFEDFAAAAQAVGAFRDKFGIEYATLIAGISDKADAAAKLPQLNGVYAFPTTLFIDRNGRVRRIHTGFTGPATGEHYEQLQRNFTATVQTLLAETRK